MNSHYCHLTDAINKSNLRSLQGALQTLFAPTPRERAKNFSENVADRATALHQDSEPSRKQHVFPVHFSFPKNTLRGWRHHGARFSGNTCRKRLPEPHGHGSFRPSFSLNSTSPPRIDR